jgi:hypothetical protein
LPHPFLQLQVEVQLGVAARQLLVSGTAQPQQQQGANTALFMVAMSVKVYDGWRMH